MIPCRGADTAGHAFFPEWQGSCVDSLEDLLATLDAPPTYKFESDAQRTAARQIMRELLEFLKEAESATGTGPFDDGPRPFVDIGSRAKF